MVVKKQNSHSHFLSEIEPFFSLLAQGKYTLPPDGTKKLVSTKKNQSPSLECLDLSSQMLKDLLRECQEVCPAQF